MYSSVCFGDSRLAGGQDGDVKETPWEITAHQIKIDRAKGIYAAEGDVVLTNGNQFLYAQKATYFEKTGMAEVSGEVRLEDGGDIFSGTKGSFNLNDQTGKITNGYIFLSGSHYHITGSVMEKLGKNTYLVKNCRLTTCDGKRPAWSITGTEVKVTVEGYGTVKHAAMRVRDIPIFYIPFLVFPAKTQRQTGLLPPRIGYSSRNGVDVEVPFFWAISEQTDASLYQRYLSRRGYMQGLEFRYVAQHASKGDFLFDILSDRKDKDMNNPDDVEISPFARSNDTRYWIRGRAEQSVLKGTKIHFDSDYVSDQDYLREFDSQMVGYNARVDLVKSYGRPEEEKYSPTRRSALRLNRNGTLYSLEAIGSYHQRPENPINDQTSQPLAGLDFQLLPMRFQKTPMFIGLKSDYDYVWRDTGFKGNRASISPMVKAPYWVGSYLEFEPSLQYTHTSQWFDNHQTGGTHQGLGAYEGNMRVLTKLERTFDVNWRNATRLQHRIWPSLRYRYRAQQDDNKIDPWFEPIQGEGKVNKIIFTIENFLDARLEDKDENVSYRQFGNLTISQGYDVEEAGRRTEPEREKRPFDPLRAVMTVKAFSDVDFLGSMEWDHYDRRIKAAEVSLDLFIKRSGGRKDSFMLDYQLNRNENETINIQANVNLNYGFAVGSALKRDLHMDSTIINDFWLTYDSQCWGSRIGVKKENNDTSITFQVKLLGLGQIGNW